MRFPLSANAKRAGWVGCNILYQKIPEQGKLRIIRDGKEMNASEVLRLYEQIKKLQTDNIGLRGWMLDVLNCINDIGSENFTLQQVYRYADALKVKHTLNRNVEAKFLRDRGFVEFLGGGVYRKVI